MPVFFFFTDFIILSMSATMVMCFPQQNFSLEMNKIAVHKDKCVLLFKKHEERHFFFVFVFFYNNLGLTVREEATVTLCPTILYERSSNMLSFAETNLSIVESNGRK